MISLPASSEASLQVHGAEEISSFKKRIIMGMQAAPVVGDRPFFSLPFVATSEQDHSLGQKS